MASATDTGRPWPNAAYGEVRGPSGARCYTADRAGELLGVSGKTAKSWGEHQVLQIDPETEGHRRRFLLADDVERVAAERGRWPPGQLPPDLAGEASPVTELLIRQGHDLDEARSKLAAAQEALRHERQSVTQLRRQVRSLESDRSDLLETTERLASVLSRSRNALGDEANPDRNDSEVQ